MIDYEEIFRDRVIYITGCGRSGTTILGKVIGSMNPTYYLFEPDILRAPILIKDNILINRMRRIIFEDYFLPVIQGRGNNIFQDDSCMWHYFDNISAQKSYDLRNRNEAIDYVKIINPYWIIKNPEASPLLTDLAKVFPGLFVINIYRNGYDVIRSSVRRGWFSDDYEPQDDIFSDGCFKWIDYESQSYWGNWDAITRAACVWRHCVDYAEDYRRLNLNSFINIKYEKFCANPHIYLRKFTENFDLYENSLTSYHINDILSFQYPNISEKLEIMEPEKNKFEFVMEKLGYKGRI